MAHYFLRNGRMRYGPGSPWERHNGSGDPSSDPAASREPEISGQTLRDQPEGGGEVEEAEFSGRSADWAEGAAFHGVVAGKIGGSSSLSANYAVAARRLPLCASGDEPSSERSSRHPCLQRHGVSRLPDLEDDKQAKRKFNSYQIDYSHIDIADWLRRPTVSPLQPF